MTNLVTLETVAQAAGIQRGESRGLDAIIRRGRDSATRTIQHVRDVQPQDDYFSANSLRFGETTFGSVSVQVPHFTRSGHYLGLHDNALSQVSSRFELPAAFIRKLVNGDGWQRDNALTLLNAHAEHSDKRFLIRSIDGEARAVLSDAYKRMETPPLLETFVDVAQQAGAVPVEGFYSDLSVRLRAVHPHKVEVFPGEYICFGMEFRNSDFGHGALSVRAFTFRAVCLNTAVFNDLLHKRHFGARASDDVALSAETVRLETLAAASAVRDVSAAALGEDQINELVWNIRKAAETEVDVTKWRRRLTDKLGKKLAEATEAAYLSPDEIHMPAGNTVYRLSNAITWAAQSVENADVVYDAQRLAGEMVRAA